MLWTVFVDSIVDTQNPINSIYFAICPQSTMDNKEKKNIKKKGNMCIRIVCWKNVCGRVDGKERRCRMKKHKRMFETYEELALDIRTAIQVLQWTMNLCGSAGFIDKMLRIIKRLEIMMSKLEEEMFEDFPDEANTNVFYGGGAYSLNVRKHPDYIYSSFGKKICKECDAFVVLAKQGIVLTSDDAKLTFAEDNALYNLNQKLMARKDNEKWMEGLF